MTVIALIAAVFAGAFIIAFTAFYIFTRRMFR